ncbi:S-adenosyl-L-methionine-dependent methyltransferase [Xylariaceae sp. AK1471]|nr:S-adenosyl-L-methionine-dependent methyltransferase [Xylariaceae sp. AK1471]
MSSHGETAYPLDNAGEAKRLADQHDVLKAFMGDKLVVAPIDLARPGLRILDSGTVDGTWLLDLRASLRVPASCTMVGTDLSAARFPASPPTGVTFGTQNIVDPWPEAWSNSFDLVHQRLVLAGAGSQIANVVNRLLETVAPGGWVQLTEAAQEVGENDGTAMKDFLALVKELSRSLGTGDTFGDDMVQWVRDAGFTNIETKVFPYDLGAKVSDPELRAKSIKSTCAAVVGLVGWASQLHDGLQCMTHKEVIALPSRFRSELEEQGGSYPMRTVWGQRPSV